ncbi:zinc knuckle (CCHC-type) family protein [Actinidia rufa]|uniref:Zinc knuckle (CCHC-type) family protein n=1 Tax=Actinidia rufa TaxID=165716 RepID=A0A7J0GTU9_9ERIC|nr:zinc knuckle (CCHC-type) family protein [Actinidia rufa]
MKLDNDNVEPVTDLQLALAYQNQFTPRRLSNSGAGANADSRIDLAFVAADPLSELVWSPHNGLSLKCADFSFFEEKTSLLWDVGPSNMVLSPPQGATSRVATGEEPIDEGNLITSQVAFQVANVIDEGPSLVRSPRSIGYNAGTINKIEKMNIVGGASIVDANLKEEKTSKGKGLCSPNNVQIYSINETKESNAGPEKQKTEFIPLKTGERRFNIAQTEPSAEHNEVKVVLDIPVPNVTSPGRRHTDLSVAIEEEHKNKMKIDGPINVPPPEKLGSSAENELQLLIVKGKSTPPEAPPNNSRTGLNRRKRKEKAFSDGNVNERTSKDEDGSHESVESCNSAVPVLFSTGKKRWSFEQLTVESKRMKKQIREGPSTCFIRQDSSFVNWISNMVKGLNKTNQDEVPSLALTLSHPDHEDKSADQKIITCRRNNDIGCMNMGFQTIFQSLYSSNPNKQERKMLIGNSPIRMSKHVVLDNKLSGACITPMSCYGDFDEFCKKFVLPKKKFNESISGNEAGPSVKPNTSAANIVTSSCSDQNKISRKLACTSVKYGRNSSFSRGKHKIESDENNDSDPPRDSEGINKVGGRCDDLENFWITRFSSKTSGTVLNLDECNLNTSNALMCSTDCTNLIPRPNNRINQKSSDAKEYSTEDLVNVVGKELHNYAPNSDASFGFGKIHGRNDQKSTFKLNPIVPSPKSNNSEAMVSVFAKRLDALKRIIPSDVKDNASHTRTTCFCCGKSGRNLHDYSEIEEIERENLTRNLSSYDGAEELPCLCNRCFHLDHWAISCPKEIKQTHCEVDDEITDCDGKNSQTGRWQEYCFKKLRLSRMDILKWMNSQTSSLHLDGFFLRLRLGKWEEGLGGTGYYVACITGEQRGKPPQGSKIPLFVKIGGIKMPG